MAVLTALLAEELLKSFEDIMRKEQAMGNNRKPIRAMTIDFQDEAKLELISSLAPDGSQDINAYYSRPEEEDEALERVLRKRNVGIMGY